MSPAVELIDPVDGTTEALDYLESPRFGHTATLLESGEVLVVGGLEFGALTGGAMLFDPLTQTWSDTDSLTVARTQHTATLLADGSVLIVGGCADESCASETGESEIYQPSSETFTSAGTALARREHTATLLADGRVLVAGGFFPSDGLDNVELAIHLTEVPSDSVDVAIAIRNYHDVEWVFPDLKRAEQVAEFFRVVKPGGFVGIVEVSTPVEGWDNAAHRLNRQVVIDDFTAAGFELAEESDLLANPADDHAQHAISARASTDANPV